MVNDNSPFSDNNPEDFGFSVSYDFMVKVHSLMAESKSREQMNNNLGIKDNLPEQALEAVKNYAAKIRC